VDKSSVWRSLSEQAAAIRTGALSARDLADAYNERIDAYDGELQSFVARNPDYVEDASKVDAAIARGEDVGLLAGVGIAIKDNFLTADMPTKAGSEAIGVQFGHVDSHVVAKLRAAGAIFPGKVRMHEFAWGNVTHPTRNPWNLDHVPGGSSGGSGAAVAAGLCAAAMGSDTGGSIRIPASVCGTVGLKPTVGLVGRGGVIPHSWSLDHAGPLTRTVADAALLLTVLAGPDLTDPVTVRAPAADYRQGLNESVAGKRIGVIRNHFTERLQGDIRKCFDTAVEFFRGQGATVVEFDLPVLEYGLGAIFAIELASSSAYHDHSVRAGLTSGFSEDVRDLVEMGRLVSSVDYLRAEQVRTIMMRDFGRIMEEVEVVMTPTMPIVGWKSGHWTVDVEGTPESVLSASWRYCYPFNLVGLPAISLPCGFDSDGLPIGLQIASRPFAEKVVLNFANVYEHAHEWSEMKPPRLS
jgi:aspartyl-tRNA(Asn)/glutamyl-tRNA(Gln) amidotransferase subunit A